MNHATRPLLRRWYHKKCPGGIHRRRALLARDRRERAARSLALRQATELRTLQVACRRATRRANDLADKLKALHDRIPIYARIQKDERYFGRTFVIPVTFNPDAVVRGMVFGAAERDRSMDMECEFRYLADFASEKILATLREAAAEYLGMPGRPR